MATTYNVQGLPATMTSYSSTSDATAIDQVTRQYNDFGMLVYEYQAHQGTQSGSTPYVEYTYDRTLDSQFPVQEFVKGLRPSAIFYPDRTTGANNSYSYHYNDPGTADDRLNRPIALVREQARASAEFAYNRLEPNEPLELPHYVQYDAGHYRRLNRKSPL
jgi:hypothetical protein